MSNGFTPVIAGSALPGDAPAPSTPRNVPLDGGPENPSAAALRSHFANAVRRVDVVRGETTIIVDRDAVHDIYRSWRAIADTYELNSRSTLPAARS